MATGKTKIDSDRAYDLIKDQILTMQIRPNESVTELSLSQKLGIGRTPVREALKRLEMDGLIVTEGRTKRAYLLTLNEVENIFDLKIAIEGSVARWAAERGSSEKISLLKIQMQKLKKVGQDKPADETLEAEWLDRWLEQDENLHELIFEMSGNTRARSIIKNLNLQWHRLRLGILAMEGRVEQATEEHQKVIDFICKKNADAAEAAMREHLQGLAKIILKMMELFNYPQ